MRCHRPRSRHAARRRRVGRRALVLLLGAAAACEPGERESAAVAGGEISAHERHLIFLGGTGQDARAAVFVFTARQQEGATLRRSARGWLQREGAWKPLLATEWEMDPMRDPWRLVPHGPLRLLVDDRGVVSTLVGRGPEPAFRLEPGAAVGEWSERGPRRLLSRATLRADGPPLAGVLLDERWDGAAPAPQPTIFLTDGQGLQVVLADNSAWVLGPDGEERWSGALLERPAAEASGPTLWRLDAPQAEARGELRVVAAGPGPEGLVPVRGWLELAGERVLVFGLVRHGGE